MLKELRKNQILTLLEQHGSIEVSQLCGLFNVTKMTVRRDLDELEQDGKITRTHGGAVLTHTDLLLEKPFLARVHTNSETKDKIGVAALATLRDGQKIFISSGSTCFSFARKIDNTRRLLIATDSLNIALELSTRTNISIIMIGGELRNNTLSVTGTFAESMMHQMTFDTAYIGVTGISEHGILYHGSLVDYGLLNGITAMSDRLVILSDSQKLGKHDFVKIGTLQKGNLLITDSSMPKPLLESYTGLGAEVLFA